MDERTQRLVAAWTVVVLGGLGGFLLISYLEGRPAWTTLYWYVGVIALAAFAGALPVPWSPLWQRESA